MSESSDPTVRVLFVCMGNICRSPTAEAVFRHRVESAGLQHLVDIDSAGTHGFHTGRPPDQRAQEAAARRGFDLSSQRARQFTPSDFQLFHWVLAMDDANYGILEADCPPAKRDSLHRFMAFGSDPRVTEVPDPYYGGEQGFERVLDLIEDAANGLLETIRREHQI